MADDPAWPFQINGHLVEVLRVLAAHEDWLTCKDVVAAGGLERMPTHNWLFRLVLVGHADKQDHTKQFRYRLTEQGQQFAEHVRREAEAGRLRLEPVTAAGRAQLQAEQQATAVRLHEQHMPVSHISRQIGRSWGMTDRLLREAGVPMRPSRPRRSPAKGPKQLAESDVVAYNTGRESIRSMAARLGLSSMPRSVV